MAACSLQSESVGGPPGLDPHRELITPSRTADKSHPVDPGRQKSGTGSIEAMLYSDLVVLTDR